MTTGGIRPRSKLEELKEGVKALKIPDYEPVRADGSWLGDFLWTWTWGMNEVPCAFCLRGVDKYFFGFCV